MAACSFCVICFWVLMAGNAVRAFETNVVRSFLPSENFAALINGKPSQQDNVEKRVQDLKKTVETLSHLNENKEGRLGNLETAIETLSHLNENKEGRLGNLETAIETLSHLNENKEGRLGNLETAIANLTSKFDVDCGSPTPCEDTDVVYSSTGLYAVANYRCKKGFSNITPREQVMSFCGRDGSWTKVNMKCANISSCWWISEGKASYTGTQSTTRSGKTCQRWDSQEPHTHKYTDDDQFVISGFDAPQTVTGSANYCRDPSHEGYLWCYTTDPDERWDTCEVPLCYPQH